MLTVSCLSQKGGVGKSTLARMIGTTYAHAGWRVKIADFNLKQKTSVDWSALRMAQTVKPDVPAEAFTAVNKALAQNPNYDIMVFDGRPDSDVSTLDIAENSDLIVIPVGVTLDDLTPQVRFAHELRSKAIDKRRIIFVVNKSVKSQLAIDDAKQFIIEAGFSVAETDIPIATGYQIAQNSGRALTETTFPTLNKRAEALAQELVTRIDAASKVPAA